MLYSTYSLGFGHTRTSNKFWRDLAAISYFPTDCKIHGAEAGMLMLGFYNIFQFFCSSNSQILLYVSVLKNISASIVALVAENGML